jgi:hypothetical protein
MLVKDATVTVSGFKAPKANVPYVEMNNEYRAEGFGWDELIRLEIVRGQDRVETAVASPGTTALTAPTTDATVQRASGLTVTWRDGNSQPANTVRLRLGQAMYDVTLADDKFEYAVPSDRLVVTDREDLYLERSNEVAPAGATAGSAMTVSTYHSARFRVE